MVVEKINTYGWEAAFRGLRNPMDSWHISDSAFGLGNQLDDYDYDIAYQYADIINGAHDEDPPDKTIDPIDDWLLDNGIINSDGDGANFNMYEYAFIGPRDMDLAQRMIAGGEPNDKYLRQIMISMDITAPLYW